jgi:hypothetical protein
MVEVLEDWECVMRPSPPSVEAFRSLLQEGTALLATNASVTEQKAWATRAYVAITNSFVHVSSPYLLAIRARPILGVDMEGNIAAIKTAISIISTGDPFAETAYAHDKKYS